MRKVLLVIEDYKELVGTENFLRRLGFDVLSVGKDLLVNDALMKFHAEIVVSTWKSRHVDGLKLAARLKKQNSALRFVLLLSSAETPELSASEENLIDAFLEMPLDPPSAIRILAKLAQMNPEPLLEKYEKMASARMGGSDNVVVVGSESDRGATTVTGGAAGSASSGASSDSGGRALAWDPISAPGKAATARSERSNRYDQFLATHDVQVANAVLPREKAQAAFKELKASAEAEKDLIDRVNQEKRAFAEALFEMENSKEK